MIEELLELILLKWEKRVKKKREDSFFSFRRENLEVESEIGNWEIESMSNVSKRVKMRVDEWVFIERVEWIVERVSGRELVRIN